MCPVLSGMGKKGYKARDLEVKFWICLGIYSITVPMMTPPSCPENAWSPWSVKGEAGLAAC